MTIDLINSTLKITINFTDYLEMLWHHRDKANITRDTATIIQSIDPNEIFCHVEWPEDNEHRCTIPAVWRKRDWETDIVKYRADKKKSEEFQAMFNERGEIIKELTQALMTKGLPEPIAYNTATTIYDSNNTTLASAFGIGEDKVLGKLKVTVVK